MTYVTVIILGAAVCYLLARLLLLKKTVREAQLQLKEINQNLEENRIVTLSLPNKEMEALLEEINHSLQGIRAEKVRFQKWEMEFKQQIESISHDLRTPLTSMIGYLRIMDVSGLGEEEYQDLQVVLKKAERLQELITSFYDLSRLELSEYKLEREQVDAAKVLRSVLADSYGDLVKQSLEVEAEIPEMPVYILGDAGALQRVFQNLLQNAGRYAVSRFMVSVKDEGEQIVLSFCNDVKDFSERDAERIFERFYTQDKARNSGATGLGLTIAKEFVEQMKGSIEAFVEGKDFGIILRFPKER